MRNKTEFELLLETLDSLRLFVTFSLLSIHLSVTALCM